MGATAVIGIGLFAASSAFSARAKQDAGRYNQQVFNTNADISIEQAKDAIVRGADQEERHRLVVRRAIGQARTAYASQGVEVNTGSAVDVQSSIAYMGELDSITIRNNAAREAWGYRVQAYNYRQSGQMARYEGNVGAISTVLGAASSYYSFNRGGGS